MYAFVSNEFRAIIYSQRQLDFFLSIYTYPQFRKVDTQEEAKKFFIQCNRKFIESGLNKFGRDSDIGYITIEYFISDNNIYCNIYTKHFGFIKLINLSDNVIQDASYDLLKLKIKNVVLDDSLIAHHCIAIQNILRLFDTYINVELIIPDISVYLACTKYKGKNFSIRNLQGALSSRMGSVFYTIK